ncbi:MAG: alanine--tRNA ligase [Chloroflexota bacterium]
MTGDEIREAFLRFFESKGHLRIPSSSLIPAGDPTLLLTNAGMVQFKPYFTGEMTPPQRRLTSAQKCFRTTDIDSVGDSTHLTFFEMLGNFSVGDYFKKEAIEYAWEFLTEHLELEKERLWATVYLDDDEAFGYWTATGIPAERIRRFGEEDNFWGPAGSEGPCGPCSEIHYDFGEGLGCCQPDCGPNCENPSSDGRASTGHPLPLGKGLKCDRFVELWNLVFTQYYQAPDGSRTPLPTPNIDTGMGLERCAVILQGKRSPSTEGRSIYETDIFQPLVQKVAELCRREYGHDQDTDYAIRVVAEHARSAAFLIADGVVPGNDGRDYVLRRVIRRAIRYGKKLGLEATENSVRGVPPSSARGEPVEPYERSGGPAHALRQAQGERGEEAVRGEPFGSAQDMPVEPRAVLPQIAQVVIERMKGQYPDLEERREFVLRVMGLEEERFGETSRKGMERMEGYVLAARILSKNDVQELRSILAPVLSGPPLGHPGWYSQQAGGLLLDLQQRMRSHADALPIVEIEARLAYLDVWTPIHMSLLSLLVSFGTQAVWGGQEQPQVNVDELKEKLAELVRLVGSIGGNLAFELYDTYGFPVELTAEIAREHGLEVDMEGFQREMEAQRERARAAAGKFGGDFDAVRAYQELGVGSTTFLGYETLSASSVVVGLLIDGQPASQATEGQQVEVVLRETPFYAEMGGQMGDAGEIVGQALPSEEGQGSTLRVEDTQTPIAGLTVHRCTVVSGSISLGDTVEAKVDPQRRSDIARNHTATHMLHAALRQVLGTHVRQHGSLVTPDRLRFDFTHVSPLSPEELREVQRLTNEKIRENMPVESHETTYRQAVSQGALAFFGDRYGDRVRVVAVADPSTSSGQAATFSMEVCGGTHVHRTGDIGLCHIVSESSIGSGLRRIEAVTGRAAEELMASQSATLDELSQRLQISPDQLASRVDGVLAEMEQAQKRAEALERELLKRQVSELPRKQVAGINVVSGELNVSAVELLREAGDWLKNDIKSGVVALGTVLEGRPAMVVMATADMVAQGFHAGNAVREAAKAMGGGGGGRAETGQAGGREPGKLKDALRAAEEEVRRWREKP